MVAFLLTRRRHLRPRGPPPGPDPRRPRARGRARSAMGVLSLTRRDRDLAPRRARPRSWASARRSSGPRSARSCPTSSRPSSSSQANALRAGRPARRRRASRARRSAASSSPRSAPGPAFLVDAGTFAPQRGRASRRCGVRARCRSSARASARRRAARGPRLRAPRAVAVGDADLGAACRCCSSSARSRCSSPTSCATTSAPVRAASGSSSPRPAPARSRVARASGSSACRAATSRSCTRCGASRRCRSPGYAFGTAAVAVRAPRRRSTARCMTAGMVVWGTLMSTRVPPDLRGRVHSLDWFVSIGLTPISFALTGPVSKAIGIDATLILAAVLPAVASRRAVLRRPAARATRSASRRGLDAVVGRAAYRARARTPCLRRGSTVGSRRRRSRRPRAGRASRARAGRCARASRRWRSPPSSATVSRSASSTIRRTSSSMSCCVCSETSDVAGQQHALAAAVDGDRADDVAHPPPRDHAARDVRQLLEVGLGAGRRLAVDDALGRAAAEGDLDLARSAPRARSRSGRTRASRA